MRIYDNGIYRDMTPEEIAESQANQPVEIPPSEPTFEDKVNAIYEAMKTLGGER